MNPLQGPPRSPLQSSASQDQKSSETKSSETGALPLSLSSALAVRPGAPPEPATSLGERSASVVGTSDPGAPLQPRDVKSQEPVEGGEAIPGFSALPMPLLEIIAASASDTQQQARATLAQLARAHGRTPDQAVDLALGGPAMHRMTQLNPTLARDQLVQQLRISEAETMGEARALLKERALALGHPEGEVDAWLADPVTLCEILSCDVTRTRTLQPHDWSEALALRYVTTVVADLSNVPIECRTAPVCLAATTGPRSDWLVMSSVPAAQRTPELIHAAVNRHPDAIRFLDPGQLTLAVYEAAASTADLETFRKLPVTSAMAASPGYQALLQRLAQMAESAAAKDGKR